MLIIVELKLFIITFFFLLHLFLEKKYPFYDKREGIVKHDSSNLLIALFNITIFNSAFAYLTIKITTSNFFMEHALFRLFNINSFIKTVIIIIILDLWTYVWHRLNHQIKFLKRFHRAHHTDTMMNVTTSVRFHFMEFLLSFLIKSLIIALLGIEMQYLIVYEILLNICVYFHHSNINLDSNIDMLLNKVIVTPNMHRYHHSIIESERNSDYSGLFSIWDRVFHTYTYDNSEVKRITFGVKKYQDKKWDMFHNILLTPFK